MKPQRQRSTRRKLLTCITALFLSAAIPVFAAPPNTTFLPDFSKELLTPVSQSATAWQSVIPNALADYFTYIPYTTADALQAGFPASLNCGVAGATGSDCYTISVKEFTQEMSVNFLGGPFAGGIGGLAGAAGGTSRVGILPAKVWGYGSGGLGWTPPGGIGPVVAGNAPSAFQNFQFSLAEKGIWHFPAPTVKATKNRPVHIRWINELPNTRPEGHDPSVDCGRNAPFCFPYNRIVTHVHGAHVTPESDGLAIAWYTPNFALYGEGKFPDSAYVTASGQTISNVQTTGPIYSYPLTQEAGTIWYHDHAVGTTHLNTNMGMAGFFPITDLNEQSLLTPTAGPANVLPNTLYDYGFALQDRHFDLAGQIVMPDYGIYNMAAPACTLTIDGLPDPTTCPRLQWMKETDGHLVPYVAGSPLLANANNIGTANLTGPFEIPGQGAPFPATSATLEYFGNMPVVNGVTYGKVDIEARVNRMRFIGGTDSRVWIMQLRTVDPISGLVTATVVPFYQIASEQGLLNKPILRNEIDLMPGERIDVLVDFSTLATGTKVRMINLGGDEPYSGFQDYLAGAIIPSATIPEIMEFTVIAKSANSDSLSPATLAASAGTPLRPGVVQADGSGLPIVLHGTPAITRNVSLIEITDQYGRTMPTIDGRGFIPPGVPITEIIFPNQVEQWDIINTTVDAHPMHIHQVAFQTINRQAIDLFVAPGADTVTQTFTPPQYTAAGAILPAEAWETGEKDTIQCPPGYVTRVKTVFDLLGEYVWHCHILSHEEHDMMRPFMVTTQAVAPQFINVPANTLPGVFSVSWGGTSVPGAQYVLQQKIGAGAFSTIYTGTATKVDLFRPTAGTYSYQVGVIAPPFSASTFTAVSNGAPGTSPTATVVVAIPPATSVTLTPAPPSPQLQGTPVTFTAAAAGGSGTYEYRFWLKTGATWAVVQNYSATDNWTWITTAVTPGTYAIQVDARSIGSTTKVSKVISYTISAPAPTIVTLTPAPASPQLQGTPVTFTAAAAGGSGTYEYRFWLKTGATWAVVQNYSATNNWAWITTAVTPGTYAIQVDARSIGSTTIVSKVISYTISAPAPTSVTLTPAPASPQLQGTPVTFTAAAAGGSGTYEYRFWLKTGATWAVVQNYSATDNWTWITTAVTPGTYAIQVDARSIGSTTKVSKVVSFSIN